MTVPSFSGLWPASPTLIDDHEGIDVPANRKLARRLLDAGADGLWMFGSGGEGTALSDDARRRVVSEVLDATGGDLPVLVGISAESTRRALDRWQPLSDLPVAGVFATPPIYYTYTQPELIHFFDSIATETGQPTFVYHNPFFAHTSLTTASVVELSHHAGIVGAKDSTTSMVVTQQLIAQAKEGFALFQGEERLAGLSLLAGATGIVSVISASKPEIFVDLVDAARDGDLARVLAAQTTIDAYVDELGLSGPTTNGQFIGAVKRALASDGYGTGTLSAPFLP